MKKPLLVLVLLLSAAFSFGQDETVTTDPQWEFTIAPYMLFGSVNGDARLGPTAGAEVDASFKDILEKLKFAFMLHGEAYRGRWGLMADYMYLKLGSDISTPQDGIVEAELKESIFEVFGSYRIKKEWGWYDVYAGIRAWNLKVGLELQDAEVPSVNADQNWVDPVIGGRVFYETPSNIILGMRADIGGFGVGSNFSYNLQPMVGYQFSDLFTLMLQYKYLYADYENGTEGTPRYFALDAATNGPLLGFVFRF
jgi:hypothetical protein